MPTLKLKDTVLYYDRSGQGTPILFIQGVGAGGQGWRHQFEHFSKSHDVASYDNRGFGRSSPLHGSLKIEDMAEDARELMDCFGWKSAHVVGHSMGGLIAQQLAISHPSRIRSLILLCTFSQGREATRLTPATLAMGVQTRIGTRRMRRHALLRMIVSRKFLKSANLDATAARYGEDMGRDLSYNPPIIVKQMMAMSRSDMSGALSRLSHIPTLVANATEDPIALPQYGRRPSDAISGSRYVELPDASHAVMLEQPLIINKLIEDFLNEAEPAASPIP